MGVMEVMEVSWSTPHPDPIPLGEREISFDNTRYFRRRKKWIQK
jgi:hypothetical protein